MKLHGHRSQYESNVRSLFSARRAAGPRFAYHALFGAPARGRAEAVSAIERGVPVYLPPVPSIPGVDMTIEVSGVPATAILSAGQALPSGVWMLTCDDVPGLRLLPASVGRLSGPVTLRVTVSATDRATGQVASLSASIEVAGPWDGGASAGGRPTQYSLADDAGGRFEIDPVSGLVAVADEALLDPASERNHVIAVRTTAADGTISIRRFKITLLDGAGEFSITDMAEEERQAAKRPGAVVGTVAIDADAAERVSFRLTDDAEGRFVIDPSTGVVALSGTAMPSDGAQTHVITVEATSDEGWISVQRFTIGRGSEGGFVVFAAPEEVDQPRLLADHRPHRGNPVLWELPAEFAA